MEEEKEEARCGDAGEGCSVWFISPSTLIGDNVSCTQHAHGFQTINTIMLLYLLLFLYIPGMLYVCKSICKFCLTKIV